MPLLDVSKLKMNRGERVDFQCREKLPPLPVEGEDIKPTQEVEYRLSLTNADNAIVVDGIIKVDLLVQCNRCLDSFVYPMEAQLQETYYDCNLPQSGDKQPDWVPFSGDQIDIAPEVTQTILVNLPMRFICREDCRGLCSVCGVDLNNNQCQCPRDELDPRLAKLKDLLN
ncbi:MAG: hypothetical protein VR67_15795 [Peptococcaceae bacterium BRH_c8a]|nr:MAG: hypothetical protein VR67_15795 [Peptococcaceae bacterium BRH_c8a]